jgi:hypothetical protein
MDLTDCETFHIITESAGFELLIRQSHRLGCVETTARPEPKFGLSTGTHPGRF